MKVLLLGDASNYHRCLAGGLVALGHQVTVASHGSHWMQTARDIDIGRRRGRIGGALLWTRLNTVLAGRLKGYDVVQIHNPVFLELRPARVRAVFDRLRRDNGGVFLTALGTDSVYVDMCLASDNPLRYSEFAVDSAPTPYALESQATIDEWRATPLTDHCRHVYDHIDGAVSALYEYHLACLRRLPSDKVSYGGIPVEAKYEPRLPIGNERINIMLACHKGREAEKGADRMLPVLQRLAIDYPETVNLDFVQDVPFQQFNEVLDRADVVVDQLYSYTPATTALMAMAKGKVVVSGAEPEYYDFIGENRLRPIINVDPANVEGLYDDVKRLLFDRRELERMSAESPEFVRKHNDVSVVARRFSDFWERRVR